MGRTATVLDVNVWTSRLIGRDRELAALGSFLDEAVADGATLLLTGEPGVGKTALLAAAAEMATTAGFEMIRGLRPCPGRLRGDRPGTARPGGRDGIGGGPAGRL
jgi:stage III sporulation protein SpoIIIAA